MADALDIKKTYEKLRHRNLQKVVIGLAVLGDADSNVFFLVDAGAMLRHVGGKMETKSVKMRQLR